MKSGEAFVSNFLAHYASEYYDPTKARDYYLRTRELKGRQSTSDLKTDRQKQGWAYAKNQIGEAKKADLQNLSDERRESVEKSQQTAQARREEISQKLSDLLKLLTNKRTTDSEKLEADTEAAFEKVEEARAAKARKIREAAQRQIDAIPAVPDGVVGPARERLTAIRSKKIAKINGDAAREIRVVANEAATEREAISADADTKRKALSTQTAEQKDSGRESASANRERVANELKATVERARVNYEAGKARLIAEYEVRQQEEFDAIRTRV